VLRLATPADAPALAAMFARAFFDDPVTAWSNPDARNRLRGGETFFGGRLRTLIPHELSWTTDDRAAAALWAPPDAWKPPLRELVRMLPAASKRRAPLVLFGLGGIESAHPREPHLYLAVLGVDSSRQRQGLGSRVLAPGLEMCDREGTPAYLETAKAHNVSFYERHGFRVTEERRLPRGPKVWLMWRDPR
jgi:ribosomal protein S18 acetylase RimI-like enzyme